jgi:lysozyme
MGQSYPENAVELCRRFEGFHKKGLDGLAYPYICPAGVWTIGYGTTRFPDGSRVTKDTQPITEARATEYLEHELNIAIYFALTLSPILAQSNERLGAIASFIYNLVPSAYKRSTLRRRVNEGNWEEAKKEILKWVYGGGKRLPGLVLRRQQEAMYL